MAREIQMMKNNLKLLANNMEEQSDSLEQSAEKMLGISKLQNSGAQILSEIVIETERETVTTNNTIQEVTAGVENVTESAQEISSATNKISE